MKKELTVIRQAEIERIREALTVCRDYADGAQPTCDASEYDEVLKKLDRMFPALT